MASSLILLFVAILFETTATLLLKPTPAGFTAFKVAVIIACYGLSFYMLSTVMKYLPMGTVYATWSGLGTLLIAILGARIHKEQISRTAGMGVVLTVLGLVLMNV